AVRSPRVGGQLQRPCLLIAGRENGELELLRASGDRQAELTGEIGQLQRRPDDRWWSELRCGGGGGGGPARRSGVDKHSDDDQNRRQHRSLRNSQPLQERQPWVRVRRQRPSPGRECEQECDRDKRDLDQQRAAIAARYYETHAAELGDGGED